MEGTERNFGRLLRKSSQYWPEYRGVFVGYSKKIVQTVIRKVESKTRSEGEERWGKSGRMSQADLPNIPAVNEREILVGSFEKFTLKVNKKS